MIDDEAAKAGGRGSSGSESEIKGVERRRWGVRNTLPRELKPFVRMTKLVLRQLLCSRLFSRPSTLLCVPLSFAAVTERGHCLAAGLLHFSRHMLCSRNERRLLGPVIHMKPCRHDMAWEL